MTKRPFHHSLIARCRPLLFGAIVAVSLWCVAPVQACPGCRTTGAEMQLAEPDTVQAGVALSWSVLFLLVVVGGVLSVLGVLISNTIKRIDRERAGL